MQDTKLTHSISVQKGLIRLPLTSLKGSVDKEAFLDHEYCNKTHRHLRLRTLILRR